ncbi:transcriptional regulator [Marinobacter sp.]|uniref:transcriptional regulator n=1 Tax=Marinobacter sp. TaxID=50741 RepID=UPI003A9551A4
MYKYIFFTNVLRLLGERRMTKSELADLSSVSGSYLSDLTTGNANPSLEIMESIANALEVPLPLLLESTDLDKASLDSLFGRKMLNSLPAGYVRISVVLPDHKAFQVKKWGEETRKKLQDMESVQKND